MSEISRHQEKERRKVTAHAQENEIDFLRSVVNNIVSRDGISKIHTHKSQSFLCDN